MSVTVSPENHTTPSPELHSNVLDGARSLTLDEARIKSLYLRSLEHVTFKNPSHDWYLKAKEEYTRECLNHEPSATTQYFRKSLSFILQNHPPSLALCESVEHLPLPLSKSLMPKVPVSITCKNMVIQMLAKSRLNNESSVSHLTWYANRCFAKEVSSSDLVKPIQIRFQQQNRQYDLVLSHILFIKLFYPNILADALYQTKPNDLFASFKSMLSPYSFFVSDRRFSERLLGTTFVFESMLATDSLDLILDPLARSDEFCSSMMRYVAFLLHHGISTSTYMLSPSLVMTLFKVSAKLLEQSDHPLRVFFSQYVWEAFRAIQKSNPSLASTLASIPEIDAPKQQIEPFFSHRPEESFLLRDLETCFLNQKASLSLQQSSITQKQRPIHHVSTYQQIGNLLLEPLVTERKGIHFVFVTNGTAQFMQNCLLDYFKKKVFHVWTRYVQTVSPEKAIEKFVNLWKLSHTKNTPLLLQVISLLDPTQLFDTYKKLQIIKETAYWPGDVAFQHMKELSDQPKESAILIQKIHMAAKHAHAWLINSGLTDANRIDQMYASLTNALGYLINLCEKKAPLVEIKQQIGGCFHISGQHKSHKNHLESFFTQFLLAGHLLSISLDTSTNSPQATEAELRLGDFVSSQVFASTKEEDLKFQLQEARYLHLLDHLIFVTCCQQFSDLEALRQLNRPILSYIVFDQNKKDLSHIDAFIQNQLQTL